MNIFSLFCAKLNQIPKTMNSWLKVPQGSDFTIYNIPFGICSIKGSSPRVCSIIGQQVIDLLSLHQAGYLKELEIPELVFDNKFLNDFIELGKALTSRVRERIIELFSESNTSLKNNTDHHHAILHDISDCQNLLPLKIWNYTDFYSSREHATNVGSMFRDPANALLPNWKHIPIGYHGRASSITVSGTNFHRPNGQMKPPTMETPVFGPSKQLDFELEMGFIVGKQTRLGEVVKVNEAEDYIFGMALFNDWSARDIQAWEYVPLGPFLGKNFNSTISPWIVTMEALEPFRTIGPEQDVDVLPYLKTQGAHAFDIQLTMDIVPQQSAGATVCRSNFKYMYWSMAQQLAHHTVNGCNISVGDVYASGTISGSQPDSFGSMLELAWKGTRPLQFPGGITRSFIEDNDTVIMRGFAEIENIRVGFGESRAKVLPAIEI
jgi:fumarylacetoacetase